MYPVLPQTGDAPDVSFSADDSPVERSFIADLILFYGYDMGSHYQLVSNSELLRHKISSDELHSLALANLRNINLDIRAHKGDRFYMITAGGNYEAVLPLLPEVCDSLSELVDGNLVAAIAARDIFLVTSGNDRANLAALRSWTSKQIERAEKPLSRNFMKWNGEQWSPYSGFAE